MRRLAALWRNLLRRGRTDRELDEELAAMFDLLVEEQRRAGLSDAQARRAATIALGQRHALKEQIRDVKTGAWAAQFAQDLHYGARIMRRNPLFAAAAILSLAVGIAAPTTIFTIANGLLLQPAPGVADPATLVDVVHVRGNSRAGVQPISYADYADVRRRVTALQSVAAYGLELTEVSLRVDEGAAERRFTSFVSTNYFATLGIRPAAGRLFDPADSQVPSADAIVLSHRLWTQRFQGDRAIVGRTVRVNGRPVTVIGVAAEGFTGTTVLSPEIWTPIGMVQTAQADRGVVRLQARFNGWLMLIGRLRPDVSRAQASADVAAIGAALAREFPQTPPVWAPPELAREMASPYEWSAETSTPIPAGVRLALAGFLTLLGAIVSVVLVAACANLAGILLARATSRRREIAVRSAIGAGRARVVRQLVTETLLLFVIGGGAGLLLSRLLTAAVVLLLPAFPTPVDLSMPLDLRVAAFALTLALAAAVLAGLTPALQASRLDVVRGLRDDAPAPDRLRLRNAFVAAQVAGGALLVVLAAVLARGFDQVVSIDRGFDARGVDVATVDLSMAGYTETTGAQFARELLDAARRIPAVASATVADRIPGPGTMSFGPLSVPGVPASPGQNLLPNWMPVDSGYFATLRIPLLAGRDFTASDRAGAERVAIIGERGARRLWPDRDPIGQLVTVRTFTNDSAAPSTTPIRIVGVARDRQAVSPQQLEQLAGRMTESTPFVFDFYVPWQQHYRPTLAVFARARDGRSVAGELRRLIAARDPDLAVLSAQTLESQLTGPMEVQLRIAAGVAASVGLVALLLAAIGVYGVTAYAVAERTREIGIRLSLGAGRSTVIGMVLRQGLRLVGTGTAVGLLLGAAAGLALSRSRLQVPPPDPLLLAGSAVVFVVLGLIACAVPVLRAVRIRAVEALKYE